MCEANFTVYKFLLFYDTTAIMSTYIKSYLKFINKHNKTAFMSYPRYKHFFHKQTNHSNMKNAIKYNERLKLYIKMMPKDIMIYLKFINPNSIGGGRGLIPHSSLIAQLLKEST